MGKILNFYGLDQLADDPEMVEYLTIRVSRSELGRTIFDVEKVSEPVENGDYLVAALQSDDERYQTNDARICVGKGIWGEHFEKKLIGLPMGYSHISVDGTDVAVEIRSIKRKMQARVTADFVRRQLLDDILTTEQYWNYRVKQYCEKEMTERKRLLEIKALDIMRSHSEFANLDNQSEACYQYILNAIQFKADRKKCDVNDLLGATPEAREKKKKAIYEQAVRLAQFYEIVYELACSEDRKLECSEWGRPAQMLAGEIMDREFGDKFQIVYED